MRKSNLLIQFLCLNPLVALLLANDLGFAGDGTNPRYQKAVQEAEARFQKKVKVAQEEFVREITAAQSLLDATPKLQQVKPATQSRPRKGATSKIDLPVSVVGADPVPLVESSKETGWSDVPQRVKGSVIFEPQKTEAKDGVVQFKITRDAEIGLAASWAYDGNASGGWLEDRFTKQDLQDRGWTQIGQMYRDVRDRHTLFVKQCKRGEVFAVRTRKYNRPYIFVPGILPAEAQPPAKSESPSDRSVEVIGATRHATEKFLPHPERIPDVLDGSIMFESPLAGVAVFRIHQPGKIYVAASWDYDGNTAGQWTEERWTKEAFIEQGFNQIGEVAINHHGTEQTHLLFVRDCKKGDHFRIRTRKYGAPYVFVPSANP